MSEQEHIIEAVEPAWVRQEYEANEHGEAEPVSEYETLDLIDDLHQDSSYECSCGVELSSWDDVQVHLVAVTDTEA
jgi:hypothetical protein